MKSPWWCPVHGPSEPKGAWYDIPGWFSFRERVDVRNCPYANTPPEDLGPGTGHHQGRTSDQDTSVCYQDTSRDNSKTGERMANMQPYQIKVDKQQTFR
ncbi:MAG: hypothetical protein LC658_06795 [Bacteroidales bacterium]|nr:hypothetical protein [Bacteroidales bacterium]